MAKENLDIIIRAKDYATKNIKNIIGGLSALAIAKKAFDVLKIGVEAYNESEVAANKLAAALDLVGKKSETNNLLAYAQSIQSVTTADDEAIVGVMTLGASIGKMSGDTLKQATVAAYGLSKSLNIDVETAMTMVAKAAQGNTATFSRYGMVLDENATDQEKFNYILQQGVNAFSMAEQETMTTAGAYQQAKNALGDYMEGVGQAVVQNELFQGALQWAAFTIKNWKIYADIGINSIALAVVSLKEDIVAVFTHLPEVIDWFGRNWRNIIVDSANYIKSVFLNMGENIKNLWSSVWDFIKGGKWDFDWTPLTEGFKRTTEELAVIADRPRTELENYLQNSVDQAYKSLEIAKAEAQKPLSKTFSAAVLSAGGGEKPAATPAAKAAVERAGISRTVSQSNNAAMESRFIQYRQGGTPEKDTADNTKKTARLAVEQVKLLRFINERIGQSKPLVANSGGVKVSKVQLA